MIVSESVTSRNPPGGGRDLPSSGSLHDQEVWKMQESEKIEGKAIHARVDLYPDNPLYGKFMEIKTEIGLKSHSEVLRFLISRFRIEEGGDRKQGDRELG